jgi:glycogen debranching enzyme
MEYQHKPGELANKRDSFPGVTPLNVYHSSIGQLDGECGPDGCIVGLPSELHTSTDYSFLTTEKSTGTPGQGDYETVITLNSAESFIPGSIVLYKTKIAGKEAGNTVLEKLQLMLGLGKTEFGVELMTLMGLDTLSPWRFSSRPDMFPQLHEATLNLGPSEINVILYRTDAEELDVIGDSTFHVPGYGNFVYCGLQGIISTLLPLVRNNDLGHPLFSSLRSGSWLCEYITKRLVKYSEFFPELIKFEKWMTQRLELVAKLPPTFIPKYFAIVIISAYNAVKHRALFTRKGMKPKVIKSQISSLDIFQYDLELTAYQVLGNIKNTCLLPRPYPLPLTNALQQTPVTSARGIEGLSLAAGLPHFATGFMRCWGRDIFIALRGLLMLTQNYETARMHILAFGSTTRHGLIPNLLDKGSKPRYNARDAVWFWLASVVDYCQESPEGLDFLSAPVARRFIPLKKYTNPLFDHSKGEEDPEADTFIPVDHPGVYAHTSTVAQLIHEILSRHREGIHFREYNAGPNLDHAMKPHGFDIDIDTDTITGFVYGGNSDNCGTWMDKMGDSESAGTKGVPATPRDGSPIEIIGLQKNILKFVNVLLESNNPLWPWKAVVLTCGIFPYADWEYQIENSFEKHFYIPIGISIFNRP